MVVPRLSSADPRDRHRGLSHHTDTVLRMLLRPVRVPVPEGLSLPSGAALGRAVARGGHEGVRSRRVACCATHIFRAACRTGTMGRSFEEDRDFFLAGLAGGALLAQLIPKKEH